MPGTLPAELRQHVELLMNERFPCEAKIPIAALSTANFPKLVISGGYSPMQERMCDVLASVIEAHRETIPGAGHNVQRAPGCNEVLSHFWQESEARASRIGSSWMEVGDGRAQLR